MLHDQRKDQLVENLDVTPDENTKPQMKFELDQKKREEEERKDSSIFGYEEE